MIMYRYMPRILSALLALAFFATASSAQSNTCQYTLILNDSYGDGWNGGVITVSSDGTANTFTLLTGFTDTVQFTITNGAPLLITWTAGSFLSEVSYQILDNTGNVISQATPFNMPPSGTLFTGTGLCVTCSRPLNLKVDNVWDTYAKLRWSADPNGPNAPVQYLVIYGPQGFNPAIPLSCDTVITTQNKITLTGLSKKTWYDVYVIQDCGPTGGLSQLTGPVSFETYWTKDVGIAAIVSPESGCDLGLDTVRVLLRNYGAAPQSLVPFRYTVNGEDVNVPKPADGFFTGVLGKDSSEVIAFETVYDFSAPGEYVIMAFTKMTGDQDVTNDTFVIRINNRLLSPYSQQFEDWDGGYRPYGSASSWTYGTPDKINIPAAYSGQNAWVTSLKDPYNSNEISYLESPCYDFSGLTNDPVIEFALARDLESGYDGGWLERSIDDGASWEKVGAINEGLNWYNESIDDGLQLGECWSDRNEGWFKARHFLDGTAGQSNVRFRFAIASDPSLNYSGLGVDDIRIFPAFSKDLMGVGVLAESQEQECGLQTDKVTFTFLNGGSQTQNNYKVAYSINGGAPVIETLSGNNNAISPDEVISYTFNATFDSRDAISVIKCWTILNGDAATPNDTATITVNHVPLPVPFSENFEGQAVPAGWVVDGFVTNAHGNTSYVLATNLYSFNPEAVQDLPRYGMIGANDTLTFSYRITNYSGGGPMILGNNKVEVQVSTDCGDTYQTINSINSLNHSPTVNLRTRRISLGQFAGQAIKIRFLCTWASGDYWVDLDNINLLSCAADMGLTADITNASPGLSDGKAVVNVAAGNPPYQYAWSNGSTGSSVSGLANGTYTVTVTDAFGCTATLSVHIGTTAVQEIAGLSVFSLQPNPTTGTATLRVELAENAGELRVQLLNLLGQTVWETNVSNTDRISEQLNLNDRPDGIYLVRLMADGQVATKKLVKSRD